MNRKTLGKFIKRLVLKEGDILCIHSVNIQQGNDLARMITEMRESCCLPKGMLILVLREGDRLDQLDEGSMNAAGWYRRECKDGRYAI